MTADKMGSPAVSRWALIFLAVILAVGISVRCHDLAWHFATTDDMGVAKQLVYESAPRDFFCIPRSWTYAPLQFFFTKLLVSRDQAYRDLLFYGRLPSCLAGVAALFALVWFYRRLEGRFSPRLLLPLTLMACSWESIVHAKQMHNYELGVFAVILLLVLFLEFCQRRDIPLKAALGGGVILWILANAHYEILFFLPAFGAVALFILRDATAKERGRILINFAIAAALFGLLFFPTWYFFLHIRVAQGINSWSSGRFGEYVFTLQGADLLEKLAHTLNFFFYNFSLVIQSNLGFMPEELFAFEMTSLSLIALFVVGFYALIRNPEPVRKKLGFFFLILTVTWFGLVMLHKIPLSPTRHSLILLPFFCVVIGEGADRLFSRLKAYPFILSGAILAVFLFFYPAMAQERHDAFNESEILALIEKYNIRGIFTGQYADHLDLMKSVEPYIKGIDAGALPDNPAWISHSGPVDFLSVLNLHPCCSQAPYELVYKKELESYREVDFSKKANQAEARNRIFVYVARRLEG